MEIKDLVKNNTVNFDSYRQGVFYYRITTKVGEKKDYLGDTTELFETYIFPVPVEDIGTATMLAKDKALFFMRWIRKAIEDKTLIKD